MFPAFEDAFGYTGGNDLCTITIAVRRLQSRRKIAIAKVRLATRVASFSAPKPNREFVMMTTELLAFQVVAQFRNIAMASK